MKKTTLVIALAFVAATPALASHLPEENWPAMNSTVQIVSYEYKHAGYVLGVSSGSGTVLSPDGLVLTNNHVIFDEVKQRPMDAFEVCLTFDVKKEPLCQYTAKLVSHDKELDLALLKIDGTDVFGNPLPALNYRTYAKRAEPKEEAMVQVLGYPASGGDTITITRGQISGFDTFNNYKYFKTDTDFDHGSSGGTALDAAGNFIGVPTYIRSYAENVGYFLDLNEALPWLAENTVKTPAENSVAQHRLIFELARFMKANKTLQYQTEGYPFFAVSLPDDWHFDQMDDDHFFASQKNVNDGVGMNVQIERYPYPIDEAYLRKLDEEFIGARDRFPDFKKEAVVFAGQKAARITYTVYNQRNTIIYIPYGYALVGLSYAVNLDKEAAQTEALEKVLSSFRFTAPATDDPALPGEIVYENPPFSLRAAGDFRLQKPEGSQLGDLLIRGIQKDNVEGQLGVYYSFTPRDERELNGEEKLDEETKNIAEQGLKLIAKKKDVVLDGLPGYLYTYEYEGALYQQIRRQLVIKLTHGEYELAIEYDDLAERFDANLPLIAAMLNTFEYRGEPNGKKGEWDFGTLGQRFSDIQHHRFAADISELADKNIVEGYKDGRFRPEFYARRKDALQMILQSKTALEEERGIGKDVVFDANIENPYVAVTLGEALEWMMQIYEIPVWQGETRSAHKRYMDKGYELGLIPGGLNDESAKLTRGELSYLVNTVYNQAK